MVFFFPPLLFFPFYIFFSSPPLNQSEMGNTLPAQAAHQTPRLHLDLHGMGGRLSFGVILALFVTWIHCKCTEMVQT